MSSIQRPLTPRQLAARRANALHSTGPRTAAGKRRSALNSSKWRFCSRLYEPVIGSPDEVREFRRLHRSLVAALDGVLPERDAPIVSELVRELAMGWWHKLEILRCRTGPKPVRLSTGRIDAHIEEGLERVVERLARSSRKWRYLLEKKLGVTVLSAADVRHALEPRLYRVRDFPAREEGGSQPDRRAPEDKIRLQTILLLRHPNRKLTGNIENK